jgi:hypothetical protein
MHFPSFFGGVSFGALLALVLWLVRWHMGASLASLSSLPLSLLPTPPPPNTTARSTPVVCSSEFVAYHPSPLEQQWVDAVGHWAGSEKQETFPCLGSEAVRQGYSQKWMSHLAQRRNRSHASSVAVPPNNNIFSVFEWKSNCTQSKTTLTYIEPLVGALRNPLLLCVGDPPFPQSHTLTASFADHKGTQQGLVYLFDAGSGLYPSGAHGRGLPWFVLQYAQSGMPFDRILAFEAHVYHPAVLWKVVPDDIKPIISYYNVAVDPTPNGDHNILNFIRTICQPADHVVLKLDHGNFAQELALARQIIAAPDLQALVDEVYWEHRHHQEVSHPDGKGQLSVPSTHTMNGTYGVFTALRQVGIRAHY